MLGRGVQEFQEAAQRDRAQEEEEHKSRCIRINAGTYTHAEAGLEQTTAEKVEGLQAEAGA